VGYKGGRFSTKGKKTKIRAFEIIFKPFIFRTMTLHPDFLRILIKINGYPEKLLKHKRNNSKELNK
jgi:hypothetical protein